MAFKALTTSLLLFFIGVNTSQAQPKDPHTRDESITHAVVDVQVSESEGLYNYNYTILNPVDNVGTISGCSVDLSCSLDLSSYVLPADTDRP